MSDFPELPDFLNVKLNGWTNPLAGSSVRARKADKIVWPKKKNWAKLKKKRLEQEKREGTALKAGTIVKRKGQ